jgi:DNA-binding NarL/FixJ family response regulator
MIKLTPRQREIALLVAKGHSNRQIGQCLGITESTVKNSMREIFLNMGISNRVQLALHVIEKLLVKDAV